MTTKAKGYTVTDWCGFDNYECSDCKYKTLDLPLIEAHVAARHSGVVNDGSDTNLVAPPAEVVEAQKKTARKKAG